MSAPTVLRACEATMFTGPIEALVPVQCGEPGWRWNTPLGNHLWLCAEHVAVFERAMELDS